MSTLMLAALLACVFLIVGITLLAVYLKPKPDDLVGWTSPEPLTAETEPFTPETNEPLTVEDLPDSGFIGNNEMSIDKPKNVVEEKVIHISNAPDD